MDGSLPKATGVSYVAAPAQNVAQTQIQVQTQTEPDIDGTLATEAEAKITGALPLSPAEKARSVKARDLAAQMQSNIEAGTLEVIEEVDVPRVPRRFNQYQKAWEEREFTDGVYIGRACNDCIHAIQPRELMVTSIQLPAIEKIMSFDLGDRQAFNAVQRNDFTLALKPMVHGVDTNLNIYTESGRVYGFYVRSLPHNSNLIPDVVVKIEDDGLLPGRFGVKSMFDVQQVIEKTAPEKIQVSEVLENLRSDGETDEDFVRSIAFDPATLTGFEEYKVYGSADRSLMPKVVFRDDQFTYIQWEDWDSTRLPTAFAVRDGLDSLVNSRVRGKTYIIESIAPLISMKIGNSYLCLQWRG